MLEDNKARVRRYVDEFQSAGKEEAADALVAADIIHHFGLAWTRVDATGREGAKGFITMLRGAFPDLHAVIHEQLAEGDKVMTRKTFYGTHRGQFWGIPPTGRQVDPGCPSAHVNCR
jgi:predicted ester cyclase